MRTKTIAVIGLALFVSSCAMMESQEPVVQGQQPPIQPTSCNSPLVFQVGDAHLKAAPAAKCLNPGETHTIKIVPIGGYTVDVNDVTINPKDGTTEWLKDKKNSPDPLEITIKVPESTLFGDYEYSIHVEHIGDLDPVIRVVGGIASTN